MKILMILLIFILLIGVDKALTITNIKTVEKNHPGINPLQIEKNPIAKWFMEKFGAVYGSLAYSFVSLGTMFLAFFILRGLFGENWALYIIFIIMGLVIMNNLFWFLKYSRII